MAADHTPPLQVGSFSLNSRLVVGTGKYETYEVMQDALAASGCDTVTVAVRRERLLDDQGRSLLDFLDLDRSYTHVNCTAPPLLVAYGVRFGIATSPSALAMLTMRP